MLYMNSYYIYINFNYFNYPLTASFNAFPALNTGAFLAAIFISLPVCGFLPFLSALSLTSNDPKPTTWIFSPSFKDSAITSINAFIDASAFFFVYTALAATAAIKSDLFIVHYFLLNFILCTL